MVDIEKLFGKNVTKIVSGLTKISMLKQGTDISYQAENFRKMLLTINDDIRVVYKIADRLHNMQTLDSMTESKQQKLLRDIIHICTTCHRIGLYNIKNELEDLSLKYTDSKSFEHIKNKIEDSKEEQEKYINEFSLLMVKH